MYINLNVYILKCLSMVYVLIMQVTIVTIIFNIVKMLNDIFLQFQIAHSGNTESRSGDTEGIFYLRCHSIRIFNNLLSLCKFQGYFSIQQYLIVTTTL